MEFTGNILFPHMMTVNEFLSRVENSSLTDHDGWGHPIIDRMVYKDIIIFPSETHKNIPEGTTHIMWFNSKVPVV